MESTLLTTAILTPVTMPVLTDTDQRQRGARPVRHAASRLDPQPRNGRPAEQMSVSSAKEQSPAVDVCLPVWRNEKMSFHRHAKQWSRGKACDGIKRVGTLNFSPADRQRGNTMRSLLVALALSLSNGSMPALAAPSCQAWCTQNMCAHGGRSVSDCLSKCVPACQQKMSKGK